MVSRLSNHALIAPLPASYCIAARMVGHRVTWPLLGLQHWSDGAHAAYVVAGKRRDHQRPDQPTVTTGANAPLLGGVAHFPVPLTCPQRSRSSPRRPVATSGARVDTDGARSRPQETRRSASTTAFTRLVSISVSRQRLVRAVADGGMPVRLVHTSTPHAEAYEIWRSQRPSGEFRRLTHAGYLYGLITSGRSCGAQGKSGPAGVSEWRHDHRCAGAALARHASRRGAAVLFERRGQPPAQDHRLEQDEPLPLAPQR